MPTGDDAALVERSVERFLAWLGANGPASYDQYDFWASRLGVLSKRLFLRRKVLAAPLVLGLQLLESFCPRSRLLFARRSRFAIGDAHLALGFLNLWDRDGRPGRLEEARRLLEALRASATATPSGLGWGYPYVWVTRKAEYAPGVPFVTVTPYGYAAFVAWWERTRDEAALGVAARAAAFAAHDLLETDLGGGVVPAGYGLGDRNHVVNANAYRAALLLDAERRFGVPAYRQKALGSLRFVLACQRPDGSWPYSPDEPFVDHFHTCFVLGNLVRCHELLGDGDVLEAVLRGHAHYREHLFRADGTPRHFARATTPKFRRIETYDYAESIALGVLLRHEVPDALPFAVGLARQLVEHLQLPDGHFVTRVTTLRTRNTVAYLRWPQAQLFSALTSLLGALAPRAGAGAADVRDLRGR